MNPWLSTSCVIKNLGPLMFFFCSLMLGALEVKEFNVIPGCCLDGHEDVVAIGVADVTMLENFDFGEGSGWIQGCSQRLREGDVVAREDYFKSGDTTERCQT
jgi:hypothetical protein